MPDREKVVGHLNDCLVASRRDNTWVFVRKDIVEDAITLLKKQKETTIPFSALIHPDMDAIENRDAFLSDENGKKLREMIDQIHLMEEILNCNNCEYPNECENCARAIEDR